MIIVTGGAGFIGSALVWHLNELGFRDICIVDNLGTGAKWKNLTKRNFSELLHKKEFLSWLEKYPEPKKIQGIFHLGACSSTMEMDVDYLLANNVQYSQELFKFSTKHQIPFIYASSAATYGDDEDHGFLDDMEKLHTLRPINPYGQSKQWFDLWTIQQKQKPPLWVGLKFFNVYGPNEFHKGPMMSLVCKDYPEVKKNHRMRLFKSYRKGIPDGGQKRDFVYVKDVLQVMTHFWQSFTQTEVALKAKPASGIYNVGTGVARSFHDLGKALFSALEIPPNFEWIEMPERLQNQYQYFTQADLTKLRKSGLWEKPFTSIEDGVYDYVRGYLEQKDSYL